MSAQVRDAAAWTAVACEPRNSVVVEASAGSGKTWLLTARLFRLLLAGAKPDQILAITFTRKAAQEMQQRLFDLLRECALASEAELDEILQMRGAPVDDHHRLRARALAGEVLTNSRGVTIDTFHGWFASLSQLAPLSSGFSRQSEPTEQTAFWMDKAIADYTQQLIKNPTQHHEALQAMNVLSANLDREGMRQVLKSALGNRVACQLALSNPEAPSLTEVFDLQPDENWPSEIIQHAAFVHACDQFLSALAMGTPAQQKKANDIRLALEALQSVKPIDDEAWRTFRNLFFTKDKDEPSKALLKATKEQAAKPGFDETLFITLGEQLQLGISTAEQKARDLVDLHCTQALHAVIAPLFDCYARVKAEQGLCDFDDLEATALYMMMDPEQMAYMLQKLDTRVRHLLVDEFQDTNPVQWNILKFWLDEYSSEDRPTVFLVGDPKQSIYRFRRAEARLFEQAKAWLQQSFNARVLNSDSTRRCSEGIVNVVNRVFAPEHKKGRTPFRPHSSLANSPKNAIVSPALTVYPLVSKEDSISEAQRCVNTLVSWLKSGVIKGLDEVMVLVQTHNSAVPLMAALREADLAYSVKDKGERYSSTVWSDTIALLGFLSNPHDNLALLQLLRCPLLGLSSGEIQSLIEAGHAHQSGSVWNTVEHLADQGGALWPALKMQMQAWLETAQALPLFETLSKVVGDTQAQIRYLNAAPARQRILFAEHWDWIKAWALSVNKGRFPSLRLALEEARRLQEYGGSDGDGLGQTPNVLRILTVHSAKGLEADHVWLFDANRTMGGGGGSKAGLLIDWPLGDRYARSVTVMANTLKPSPGRKVAVELDRQAYQDEEDHLLYVALTRARHSLHVSGQAESRGSRDGWHARLAPHADVLLETWPAAQKTGASAQQDLFGPEVTPADWVRSQFPVLQPLAHTTGRNVPRPDSSELRMGTAWHAALEHIDEARHGGHFEAWWQARELDCEALMVVLDEKEMNLVKQACETIFNSAVLRPFMQGAPKAFNELEWVLATGQSLRADRVIELPTHHLVLDYKWAVNASNWSEYRSQVLEYVALVDQTLNVQAGLGATQAALIDRHGEIHWLTSV